MGIFNGIDTSASGLTAQRLRLDIISNNIANISSNRTSQTTAAGNPIPYRRQMAVFVPREPQTGFTGVLNQALAQAGSGVQVAAITEDQTPFAMEYNPTSPGAAREGDPEVPAGYVRSPNVNIVTEMVDIISASRSYEANITALNASKSIFMRALDIGKG